MRRNHLTGRRGRKRPPQWLYTVAKHDIRIQRLQQKIKKLKHGMVRIGTTP